MHILAISNILLKSMECVYPSSRSLYLQRILDKSENPNSLFQSEDRNPKL